ncbi:hypothetical protein I3842_10G151000 [Carya illinoinensis]|uniref:Uncharacterized protein n=1 Tax=Carya illinoinensis TaxID=32201 RepID=A0A922DYC0_CARIL|nr:hypothetical protein I3842_10G151000 [Carya illinoinensis]
MEYMMKHIYREGNAVADYLAKQGAGGSNMEWAGDQGLPSNLRGLLVWLDLAFPIFVLRSGFLGMFLFWLHYLILTCWWFLLQVFPFFLKSGFGSRSHVFLCNLFGCPLFFMPGFWVLFL